MLLSSPSSLACIAITVVLFEVPMLLVDGDKDLSVIFCEKRFIAVWLLLILSVLNSKNSASILTLLSRRSPPPSPPQSVLVSRWAVGVNGICLFTGDIDVILFVDVKLSDSFSFVFPWFCVLLITDDSSGSWISTMNEDIFEL